CQRPRAASALHRQRPPRLRRTRPPPLPLSGSAGSSGSTERLELPSPRPQGVHGPPPRRQAARCWWPRNGRAKKTAEPSILEPNGERLDPCVGRGPPAAAGRRLADGARQADRGGARRIFTKLYPTEKRQQSRSPKSVVGH